MRWRRARVSPVTSDETIFPGHMDLHVYVRPRSLRIGDLPDVQVDAFPALRLSIHIIEHARRLAMTNDQWMFQRGGLTPYLRSDSLNRVHRFDRARISGYLREIKAAFGRFFYVPTGSSLYSVTTLRLSEPTSIKLADLLACAYAADHGEQDDSPILSDCIALVDFLGCHEGASFSGPAWQYSLYQRLERLAIWMPISNPGSAGRV